MTFILDSRTCGAWYIALESGDNGGYIVKATESRGGLYGYPDIARAYGNEKAARQYYQTLVKRYSAHA